MPDETVQALQPWSFTYEGKVVRATRLLGFADGEMLRDKVASAKDGASRIAAVKELCEAVGLPADTILALPGPVFWAAIEDFFVFQNRVDQPARAVLKGISTQH